MPTPASRRCTSRCGRSSSRRRRGDVAGFIANGTADGVVSLHRQVLRLRQRLPTRDATMTAPRSRLVTVLAFLGLRDSFWMQSSRRRAGRLAMFVAYVYVGTLV